MKEQASLWGGRGCKLVEDGNYFSRAAKLIINQDLLSSSHVFSNNTLFPDEIQDIAVAGCTRNAWSMSTLQHSSFCGRLMHAIYTHSVMNYKIRKGT